MGLRAVFPTHANFATTHWPRRSLLHHGPLSRLEHLATAPELSSPTALLEAMVRRRLPLFVERDGEPFHEVDVSLDDPSLFAHRATYTCFGVDRFVPAVRELLYEIKCDLELPSLAPTCHGYVSGAAARIRAHFDKQENISIQVVGKKRWLVAENHTVAFPHENHALRTPPAPALRQLASKWPTTMPEPARTILMRPGSALFFPRGMWHSTDTVTPSVSLTLIFPVPNWGQTLTARLLDRLMLEERFRQPASTSASALAERADAFVRAAREVCEAGEGRYVLSPGRRPTLRRSVLEAKGVTIALIPRYVPFVRWVLSRTGPFIVAEAPSLLVTMVEAAGIVAFLEAHGVLRRASKLP
jgi:50S ribosomal protein L16 3-hydroxylase